LLFRQPSLEWTFRRPDFKFGWMGRPDQTKRCALCGAVLVLAPPAQGSGPRTLQCLQCDRTDPLKSDVLKWLKGGLQPPT
jgi:hypothetical protein